MERAERERGERERREQVGNRLKNRAQVSVSRTTKTDDGWPTFAILLLHGTTAGAAAAPHFRGHQSERSRAEWSQQQSRNTSTFLLRPKITANG